MISDYITGFFIIYPCNNGSDITCNQKQYDVLLVNGILITPLIVSHSWTLLPVKKKVMYAYIVSVAEVLCVLYQ